MELFVWTVRGKKKRKKKVSSCTKKSYTHKTSVLELKQKAWCFPVLVYSFQIPQPDVETY